MLTGTLPLPHPSSSFFPSLLETKSENFGCGGGGCLNPIKSKKIITHPPPFLENFLLLPPPPHKYLILHKSLNPSRLAEKYQLLQKQFELLPNNYNPPPPKKILPPPSPKISSHQQK